MSISSYEIGLTYAGRVNVETLTTKAEVMYPRGDFFLYSESLPTGDNGQTTRGFAYFTWAWDGFIYADMFNAFRVLCPGGSVSVIAKTLMVDYVTFGYYSAKMIWPALDSYQQIMTAQGLAYNSFKLRFNGAVVYTP